LSWGADLPLARYRRNGSQYTITIKSFVDRFNEQYVRVLPHSVQDIVDATKDYVLEEFDLEEAHQRGVDRQPQFVEDRTGFMNFQILDAYEKERIAPTIHIEQSELDRYYRDNIAEFTRVTRVELEINHFATAEAAAKSLDQRGIVGTPSSAKRVELDRDHPIPALAQLQELLFSLPAGQTIGPIPNEGEFLIVKKLKDIVRSPQPEDAVKDQISKKLMRGKMDRKECELARELVVNLPVDDHVDYRKFGIDPLGVAPWRSLAQ
jgi:hypothetical protein